MTQDNGLEIGPVAAGLEHAEVASRVAISAEGYASGRGLEADSYDRWYARQAQTLRDQELLSRPASVRLMGRALRAIRSRLAMGTVESGEASGAPQTMEGHPALALNQATAHTAGRIAFAIAALAVITAMRFL